MVEAIQARAIRNDIESPWSYITKYEKRLADDARLLLKFERDDPTRPTTNDEATSLIISTPLLLPKGANASSSEHLPSDRRYPIGNRNTKPTRGRPFPKKKLNMMK